MKQEEGEMIRNASGEKNNKTKNPQDQTVTIEIVKHRQLFSILQNPKSLWKFIGLLLVLVVLIFIILAGVSIVLKRYYPYNDIYTNIYGATTLKNEEKDMSYWLLNTAEMWANSGIKVQKNDILTIRTSGAWHTAIHHLVHEADSNMVLSDSWISSDGGAKTTRNDFFRSQFRISPNDVDGVLLMAVFPESAENRHNNINDVLENGYNKAFLDIIDSDSLDIYRIGRERINIRVLSDGILHFTVNDIILTHKNIKRMYHGFINELSPSVITSDERKILNSWVDGWDDSAIIKDAVREIDKRFEVKNGKIYYRDLNNNLTGPAKIQFGGYPGRSDSACYLDNELIYYYNKKFCDAWFVDNIGSALVIIERKNSER